MSFWRRFFTDDILKWSFPTSDGTKMFILIHTSGASGFVQSIYLCSSGLLHWLWAIIRPTSMQMLLPMHAWWRHQMETFSASLAICAGNSPVPGEFPAQRPVTRSFDVFFDLRLNKQLSKHSRDWWFETLSRPLWRHRDVVKGSTCHYKVWTAFGG